jgi:hypothetical protein
MRGDGYLTDHGEEHVRKVEKRASELIELGRPNSITPYEAYLLLLAIYFHDVGNVFGRRTHEQRAIDIMTRIRPMLGFDDVEFRTVSNLARAHGGTTPDGGEDTIALLPANEPVMGFPVRKQALAAVLRLADELAEDSSRAARFLTGVPDTIPELSRLHHSYAKSLHSLIIDRDKRTIEMHFDTTAAQVISRFPTPAKSVYLIDELLRRTVKTFAETKYCMRYMADFVRIERVSARIAIFREENSSLLLGEIGYRLEDRGYPDIGVKRLKEICESPPLNGTELRKHIQGKIKELSK